jgi:uncharacterized protein with GYD domain
MPAYFIRSSYPASTWRSLIADPTQPGLLADAPRADIEATVRKLVESVGGTLTAFYFAFGEEELVSFVDLPDAVTAAALRQALSATGALASLRVTPLMSNQEGMEAMRKARQILHNRAS